MEFVFKRKKFVTQFACWMDDAAVENLPGLNRFACYHTSGLRVIYNLYLVASAGFSLRILVAGEICNVTGEYFEKAPRLNNKKEIVIDY